MKNRVVSAVMVSLVSLVLLVAACGGSDAVPAPAASTSSSTAISQADALAKAVEAAVGDGRSTQGLDVKPAQLFGEWHVSYEPAGTESLSGGFLVVLDSETGELLDLVPYQ